MFGDDLQVCSVVGLVVNAKKAEGEMSSGLNNPLRITSPKPDGSGWVRRGSFGYQVLVPCSESDTSSEGTQSTRKRASARQLLETIVFEGTSESDGTLVYIMH
jgi:hypothetical protein